MEVSDRIFRYVAIGLGTLLVVGALYFAWHKHSVETQIRELQNRVAQRDQTIEVQKGIFAKLTQQVSDLKTAIDTSTEEGKRLADEVKKSKAELVSVSNAVVQLKEQVAKGKGQQQDLGGGRTKITFDQDFGYARVSGYTITNPPDYELHLGPGGKPLKLTLALTQQKDGSWKTLTSSSDPNVAVDIGVTAVNPNVLKAKWYEGLRLNMDLGVGDGVLAGVGASARFGRFDVGPKVWALTLDGGKVFYGGSLSWAPFAR